MGRAQYLGDANLDSGMHYDPASGTITWAAGAGWPDPISIDLSVDGAPSVNTTGGRSGSTVPNYIQPGHTYDFQMLSNGHLLKVLRVDSTQGPATGYIIYDATTAAGLDITATPTPGATQPPATAPAPASPAAASWFDQSTSLFGTTVPNTYLLAGGGLLLLAVLMRKR